MCFSQYFNLSGIFLSSVRACCNAVPVCGTIPKRTYCAVLIQDGTRSQTVRVHERLTVPTLVWVWEEKLQVVPQACVHVGGMPVWWSIQRGHVLRARCAAWRRIVATSRTSGESLWVMR